VLQVETAAVVVSGGFAASAWALEGEGGAAKERLSSRYLVVEHP
jgi:hypothetical protein